MKKKLPNIQSLKEWLKAISISFLCVLFVRSFLFEISPVYSPSMEKTLLTGDYMLINKLSYGPRLIRTLLSTPFINQRFYSDIVTLPYIRLFGEPDVKRNDIVVFNFPKEFDYPVDHRTYFVKRCVAIPGDTLTIIDGLVYINQQLSDNENNLQYNYHIKSEKVLDSSFVARYSLYEGGKISDKNDYSFTLTKTLVDTLKSKPFISVIEKNNEKKDMWDEYVFPENFHYKWNVDNYGPLVIPKKGAQINLDTTNLCIYKDIITQFEHNTLEVKGDSIFINQTYCTSYQIQQNYYFMLGDNRHNSQDSRHWGFVPEDHIIGKTSCIVFSKDELYIKGIRWNRCFKLIE